MIHNLSVKLRGVDIASVIRESSIFVSHKKVKKLPMSKGDYNIYRGWKQSDDEDEMEDGYLVEYLDGGKLNHPEHEGYISWTPKAQFDNGYIELRPEHEQRVIDESLALCTKLNKLNDFIGTKLFETISKTERVDLQTQSDVMSEYLKILNRRIKSFK